MKWFKKVLLGVVILFLLFGTVLHIFIKLQVVGMPGTSFTGTPPEPDSHLTQLAGRLQQRVEALAYDRSIYNPEGLAKAAGQVEAAFRELGFFPERQDYNLDAKLIKNTIDEHSSVGLRYDVYDIEKQQVTNFWIRIPGTQHPEQLMVIGAHYDTVSQSPGAADNAAGIACLMEITRQLLEDAPAVSVIVVAFTCEEHPASMAGTEGSGQFAAMLLEQRRSAGKAPPFGMISLDTLGNFSEEEGSQLRPFPLQFYFPDKGNFVAFVGDYPSRRFITQMVGSFRETATIPSMGMSIPPNILPDILRSDHSAFIELGVPGLMVTDTANFRIPNAYHTPDDTPEKLDYLKLARIVDGLAAGIRQATPPSLHGGDEGVRLGD
jgi:Zn-dependent M28 family amino/carboxypeptidase